MEFEKERIMYVGGPLHGEVHMLTPREDEENCRRFLGGWYKDGGRGDDHGKIASRREWVTDEPPPWSPTAGPEIDGTRD